VTVLTDWLLYIDLTADWSLLGGAVRRLHSWRSAAYTLTAALLITVIIIGVFYCYHHHHHHAGWSLCPIRRTTSYDSQLQYVYIPPIDIYIHIPPLTDHLYEETT